MPHSSTSIAWRGKLAHLVAQVQQHRPQHGEHAGRMRCICGATLNFNIQSTGLSRGHCAAGCGVRWQQ